MTLTGKKSSASSKTFRTATLSTINPTDNGLGSNMGKMRHIAYYTNIMLQYVNTLTIFNTKQIIVNCTTYDIN